VAVKDVADLIIFAVVFWIVYRLTRDLILTQKGGRYYGKEKDCKKSYEESGD
jgi:hypothetical protein